MRWLGMNEVHVTRAAKGSHDRRQQARDAEASLKPNGETATFVEVE